MEYLFSTYMFLSSFRAPANFDQEQSDGELSDVCDFGDVNEDIDDTSEYNLDQIDESIVENVSKATRCAQYIQETKDKLHRFIIGRGKL